MRRTGHGIFIDARTRSEEARDTIVLAAAAGDNHAAHRQLPQPAMIRLDGAHRLFGFELHQVIELIAPDMYRCLHSQGFQELRGRLGASCSGLAGKLSSIHSPSLVAVSTPLRV